MTDEKGGFTSRSSGDSFEVPSTVLIGVIGGSGLYHLDNLTFV